MIQCDLLATACLPVRLKCCSQLSPTRPDGSDSLFSVGSMVGRWGAPHVALLPEEKQTLALKDLLPEQVQVP